MGTKIVNGVRVQQTPAEVDETAARNAEFSSLNAVKGRKREALSRLFKTKRDAGTTASLGGVSVPLATTYESEQEISSVKDELKDGGTQKAVTRSGATITITLTIATAMLAAVRGHHINCRTVDYNHTLAINALTTVGEVEAYDITTGWPS